MMTILRVLAVIGLVYIAFVTLLYVFQERLLYLPHIGGATSSPRQRPPGWTMRKSISGPRTGLRCTAGMCP